MSLEGSGFGSSKRLTLEEEVKIYANPLVTKEHP
jgi:hypothetical protein